MTEATAPHFVGTAAICDILGVSPWTVTAGVRSGTHPYTVGYVGKLGGRHCWDVNEFLDGAGLVPCKVCGAEPTTAVGLCVEHAAMFLRVWDRAERSKVSLMQFIAICRWVVERWGHVGEIWMVDVWSTTCVTPDCDGEANVGALGPLCSSCARDFRLRVFASGV